VKAILAGRKTMTRRIVKGHALDWLNDDFTTDFVSDPNNDLCPQGVVGDHLWVRETFALTVLEGTHQFDDDWYCYRADGESSGPWTPSIFLPKVASRIWLEITDIKIQRLEELSQNDAISEGIEMTWKHDDPMECRFKNYINDGAGSLMPCQSFRSLWKSINGEESWQENPWVWVISFKVLSTTGKP
jgi:hypothetical protein